MDPRRLLLFRSVARSGSLSAAARELATTQPAVSQQLRLLEREAGLPLEWDIRNGVVQRRARRHAIPTPLSDLIVPLLAAASVGKVFNGFLQRDKGLVLWVVPNEAIYRQTLKTLKNRDHPYHQMLQVAGAGKVKILEKDDPLTRLDVESHLCVMLLMLAAASRQNKETLRFFRDRGNVLGFVPREDDIEAHWQLLQAVPNLDAYGSPWASADEVRAQKGSIVKSSLGNVMRLVRPMVVIDEGHHGYTETALQTIDGFNPCFMLELSATPHVGDPKVAGASGSNILVDVRGTDLDAAQMIKLPIHVDVRRWMDWQSCNCTRARCRFWPGRVIVK
mgnify:CR=1 FL=1